MRQYIVLTAFAFILFSSQVIAEGMRGELQMGASLGDLEIEMNGLSEVLDTESGFAFSGSAWLDEIFMPYLSLGLQYIFIAREDFVESGSFGGSTNNDVTFEHIFHLFMANAVFRDSDGYVIGGYRFYPYIGGGLGIGEVDARMSPSRAPTFEDNDSVFVIQATGGIDFDVTDKAYIGFNGSYLSAETANLFGSDVNFDGWRVMGVIGIRFL